MPVSVKMRPSGRRELTAIQITGYRATATMAGRADDVYVLAHAAKLGRRPFHAWAVLPAGWTLVTDDTADPDTLARLRDRGVTVVLATPEQPPSAAPS